MQENSMSESLSLEIARSNYLATAARENWISIVSLILFLAAWELICRLELVGIYQLVPDRKSVV